MSNKLQRLYTGAAGQAAVMSELLIRGWNVAIPEVDHGDDLFVVQDASGRFSRVQVKTGNGKKLVRGGCYTQFNLQVAQLTKPRTPEIFYVFVARFRNQWTDFLVISRPDLDDERRTHKIGSLSNEGKRLTLRITFEDNDIKCSGRSYQNLRGAFNSLFPTPPQSPGATMGGIAGTTPS